MTISAAPDRYLHYFHSIACLALPEADFECDFRIFGKFPKIMCVVARFIPRQSTCCHSLSSYGPSTPTSVRPFDRKRLERVTGGSSSQQRTANEHIFIKSRLYGDFALILTYFRKFPKIQKK